MEETIKRFCEANECKYKIMFPEFSVTSVYNHLKNAQGIIVRNVDTDIAYEFEVTFGVDIIQAKRVYKHLGGV